MSTEQRRIKMRVFVTGASGWIGSAVVPELMGAGHEGVGLARSDAAADAIIAAGAEVFRGSLDDPSSIRDGAALCDGTLAAGGANTFNMVIDRDIDAIMERTKRRPLVTGVMSARDATMFAVALEVVAFVVLALWVNQLSAWLAMSATAFYVLIYTIWLKRRSKQNIVIGGAAGAVPALIGWSAVTNSLTWTPVLLFLVIFIWTPPHFWALAVRYRDDYN